jgi:hypothetical protein
MTTYHRLFFQCPACLNAGRRMAPATHCYHDDCGGALDIGSDATLRCSSCEYIGHVSNWRYSCEHHSGQCRSTTSAHFASSMSMSAAPLAAGGRAWLMDVLDKLSDW